MFFPESFVVCEFVSCSSPVLPAVMCCGLGVMLLFPGQSLIKVSFISSFICQICDKDGDRNPKKRPGAEGVGWGWGWGEELDTDMSPPD